MPAYEPDNVFAKILRGEIPSHKLYEDDATFAFMDIMPRGEGHCLVVPKQTIAQYPGCRCRQPLRRQRRQRRS